MARLDLIPLGKGGLVQSEVIALYTKIVLDSVVCVYVSSDPRLEE